MDDLVKRLREVESNHSGWGYAEIAADRIEQLVATREELKAKLDDKEAECRHLRGQVGLLEAKLEKLERWQAAAFIAHGNLDLDIEANPEALAELSSVSCANLKGKNDD